MSEKKSVTIDSNSLLGGSGIASKRKSTRRANSNGERKIRPSSIVQPSTLKKTLLERIKQHQRTRERSSSREETETTKPETKPTDSVGGIADNFSQSIDFLRKLAMKRRQHTQKTHRPCVSASSSTTPESQMLNKVSDTLRNGEIITNTGLLGLPVVPTLISEQPSVTSSVMTTSSPMSMSMSSPMSMSMPMPMSMPMSMPMPTPVIPETQLSIQPEIPPKITELADMYNNTISSMTTTPDTSTTSSNQNSTDTTTATEPPFHIPQKPEEYLPSIFIKEEPPHGCLKNGKKPTFREWATKMLGVGGSNPHDGGATGGGGSLGESGGGGGGGGGVGSSGGGGGVGGGGIHDIDPSQIAGMRVKIRKTNKKRYRIGKHDDVVGVLLKNKQTQRHIQSQHLSLKQKTIGEIRKYLYDHHLLKIGSNAPPDVLRRMYEDAILTGEVKNTNDGIMLHNFMSGGGE
jgi:hypothetical protein